MKQKLTLKRILSLSLILGTPTVCHASADLDMYLQEATLSQEEAKIRAGREVGRLWLISMPHLISEEKDIVTQYLQAGMQRDYATYKALAEKINEADVVECQAHQQLFEELANDARQKEGGR